MDLRVDNLTVRFGKLTALDEVSLPVANGEVFVLAGPNGAGKSTLMNVVLGLIRPDSGQLLVNGQAVATPRRATSRAIRSRLGYLPEAVAFSDNLSGRQVLRFFARARGVVRQRVEEVLERVGLAHAAGRAVRGYSRGMRQRLGLGVAILSAPDLLVLDEPTGGLDQEGLALLWEVISEWRAEGRLVLLSTHDLTLIERRADVVCVLREGKVCALGSPADLRRRVGLPVHVHLELAGVEAAGLLARRIHALLAGTIDVNGRMIDIPVPPQELATLLQLLPSESESILDLRVKEPGLDEVYAHLLGGTKWDASHVH